MAETLSNNAWVDMYLTALLGGGLSKEYVEGSEVEPAATQYFFNLIVDDDEENITNSWRRARAAGAGDPLDAVNIRREYQAWRIWSIMRAREKGGVAVDSGRASSADPLDVTMSLDHADSDAASLGTSWDARKHDAPFAAHMRKHEPSTSRDSDTHRAALTPVRTSRRDGTAAPPDAARDDIGVHSPGTAQSGQSEADRENPFAGRVDKLYIVLISAHGLVRGENMELGRDADTGGQVKYVVELARTLTHHPMVHRVELHTRLIKDSAVSPDYAEEEEQLYDGAGQFGGSYIVRVKAGDSSVYLPKEQLWPHLREFADNSLNHIRQTQRMMVDAREPCSLYAIHGHYADAGEVAAKIAHTLDVPMVLTGHSLGRNKLDHLLRSGTVSRTQIEETYKISRRIEAEERALDAALMVITSTQQEVDQQWGLYDGYSEEMAAALRFRRTSGRAMPVMEVIPPGLDFSSLKVELPADPMQLFADFEKTMNPGETMHALVTVASTDRFGPSDLRNDDFFGTAKSGGLPAAGSSLDFTETANVSGTSPASSVSRGGGLLNQALHRSGRTRSRANLTRGMSNASLSGMDTMHGGEPEIWKAVHKFLRNPAKPVVLAMSRPDAKKNITSLVKAFGQNSTLREIANLVLIMGNRDDIDRLPKGSQQVISQVLRLIDAHDLYGSVAYPKAHQQSDISDIYLLAKETKGVFVNPALQEPFGLTLIEAAVHGAPIVATKHGGPVDIVHTLKNGIIVEPTDTKALAQAILDIILHKERWHRYSANGVRNILAYSWPSHCIRYLSNIETLQQSKSNIERLTTHRRARHSFDSLEAAVADTAEKGEHTEATSFKKQSHYSSSAGLAALAGTSADDADGRRSALDDLDVSMSRQRGATATTVVPANRQNLRIMRRKQLVYAMLDSKFDMALLANALRAVLDANDGALAVGVLTVLTFNEICKELEDNGVSPTELDVLVCNCGAYILCYNDKDGAWEADEGWERKVMHRWDKQLVVRTLTRMQMNRPKGSGGGDKKSDLMHLLKAANGVDMNDGNGPLHVLLGFDPEENGPLEAIDNATLIDRVRKRTRRVGVRCNLTLQLSPEEDSQEDGQDRTCSILHATPLRASRGLALRHIVATHDLITMAEAVFLCTPASVASKDGATTFGALCSDLSALVEGAQRVVVVPPSKELKLSRNASARGAQAGRDEAAFERLKGTLEPFETARVYVLSDESELGNTLQKLLKTGGMRSIEEHRPAKEGRKSS